MEGPYTYISMEMWEAEDRPSCHAETLVNRFPGIPLQRTPSKLMSPPHTLLLPPGDECANHVDYVSSFRYSSSEMGEWNDLLRPRYVCDTIHIYLNGTLITPDFHSFHLPISPLPHSWVEQSLLHCPIHWIDRTVHPRNSSLYNTAFI